MYFEIFHSSLRLEGPLQWLARLALESRQLLGSFFVFTTPLMEAFQLVGAI